MLKLNKPRYLEFINNNFALAAISYFLAYVAITAFSIPGAAVVTLLGAALFGFWASLLSHLQAP